MPALTPSSLMLSSSRWAEVSLLSCWASSAVGLGLQPRELPAVGRELVARLADLVDQLAALALVADRVA